MILTTGSQQDRDSYTSAGFFITKLINYKCMCGLYATKIYKCCPSELSIYKPSMFMGLFKSRIYLKLSVLDLKLRQKSHLYLIAN